MIDLKFYLKDLFPIICPHLEKIEEIVKSCGTYIEGNCFTCNNIFLYAPDMIPKQLNIMEFALKCTNVLEIGFNAGHSALLMLIVNPNLKIDIFDINHHKYTEPCLNYLNSVFNNRITAHWGNSNETLKNIKESKWDGFHIDGSHEEEITIRDLNNIYNLSKDSDLIMIDDTQIYYIINYISELIEKNKWKNCSFSIYKTERSSHKIGHFIK